MIWFEITVIAAITALIIPDAFADSDCAIDFVVFNADDDAEVGLIEDVLVTGGGHFCIPPYEINIQARPTSSCPNSLSATMLLAGPIDIERTENAAPYTIFGDRNIFNFSGRTLKEGTYIISANIFSRKNAKGIIIVSRSFNFGVRSCDDTPPVSTPINQPASQPVKQPAPEQCTIDYVIFNADEDTQVGLIEDVLVSGDGKFCIPAYEVNIQARPSSSCPKTVSAKMSLDGPIDINRTDNSVPYLIFGNRNVRDYYGRNLEAGIYTISSDIFTRKSAKGTLIVSRKFNFEVKKCYFALPTMGPEKQPISPVTPPPTLSPEKQPIPPVTPPPTLRPVKQPIPPVTPPPTLRPEKQPIPPVTPPPTLHPEKKPTPSPIMIPPTPTNPPLPSAPTAELEELKLHINPLDGRLMSWRYNKTSFIIFGPNGKDLNIDHMVHVTMPNGEKSILEVDSDGFLVKMVLISAAGEYSIMDLSNQPDFLEVELNFPANKYQDEFKINEFGFYRKRREEKIISEWVVSGPRELNGEMYATVAVSIFQCGVLVLVPDWLRVFAIPEGQEEPVPLALSFRKIATFPYTATTYTDVIRVAICRGVNFVEKYLCRIVVKFPSFCAMVTQTLESRAPDVADVFGKACDALYASAKVFCTLYEDDPSIPGPDGRTKSSILQSQLQGKQF